MPFACIKTSLSAKRVFVQNHSYENVFRLEVHFRVTQGNSEMNKGGKFLKKLWCCVGGSVTR